MPDIKRQFMTKAPPDIVCMAVAEQDVITTGHGSLETQRDIPRRVKGRPIGTIRSDRGHLSNNKNQRRFKWIHID